MKPARRLNPSLVLILLLGTFVAFAANTGFKIPGVLASGSSTSISTAQLPAAAPTVASASPAAPTGSSRPISWSDLVSFLEKDHTNWNTYIPGKYMCLDFSNDLVANATRQGIKAWIVAVDFVAGGPGHAFVAFATTDRGTVYVEPQADDTYPVVAVGRDLCDSWGVYQCMGTVSSIQNLQCDKAHYCTRYTP